MKKTKKALIIAFIAIFPLSGLSQSLDKKLFVAIDGFAPALKCGIEKPTSERFSLKASVGFCMVGPGILSWNFFGKYIITNPKKDIGLNVNFGLLDNYFSFTIPMYSLGFGGGAGLYYRIKNHSSLSFRLGMITGPAIENKKFRILSIPNFGIEYAFRLKKKNP